MQFLNGFHKVAALTYHNDGSEFKVTDSSPAPYEPGVSQTPAGIPVYQPEGRNKWQPLTKPSKSLVKKQIALMVAMGKEATITPAEGALDYVGTKSDAADTLATQLKWDKSIGEVPGDLNYHNELKTKRRAKNEFRKRI